MEKRKKALLLIILTVIILVFILYSQPSNPKTIKRSFGAGDEVYDYRDPKVVCESQLKERNFKNCKLIEFSRVNPGDPNEEELCIDGFYVGGCFVCNFECE
jgi:hypothetical protein